MESVGKVTLVFLFLAAVCSCSSSSAVVYNDPLVLAEITPLPRTVVLKKTEEYEPVYGIMRILEVSEENGVQKYILSKVGDIKTGVVAGVSGEISADAEFAEIVGTFKVQEVVNGFCRSVITSATYKITNNAYLRVQIGQKLRGE